MSSYIYKALCIGGAVAGLVAYRGTAVHSRSPPFITDEMYAAGSNYPDLSKHHNVLARVLTPKLYNSMREKTSPFGWTFDDCIQEGVDNPGKDKFILPVGCSVGDQESYEVFSEFFDKVIEERHDGYKTTSIHPTDMDADKLENGCCLDENYVLSTRIRTGRNLMGANLPPAASRAERRQVEKVLVEALNNLSGEFRGRYYPIWKMSEEEQQKLIEDRFLFEKPESPTLSRDWPDSRGIWHNDAKTLLVWINRDDHARIISMQKGGNVTQVFQKFVKGINAVEDEIRKKGWHYMKDQHLGYILSNPSNLGSGMRASVHIKIPLLSNHPKFDQFLNRRRLEKREVLGAHVEKGTVDISNADRMGKTEVHLVQKLIDGAIQLIEMEKALENGKSVDDKLEDKKCGKTKKA